MAKYDELGREIPDPQPIEIPLRFRSGPTIDQKMKQMLVNLLNQQAREQGTETFEEANDFDIPDDFDDPLTPYEIVEMHLDQPADQALTPPLQSGVAPPGAGPADPAPGSEVPTPSQPGNG